VRELSYRLTHGPDLPLSATLPTRSVLRRCRCSSAGCAC